MIGIEDLDEQDLREVATFYVRLAQRAKINGSEKEIHSIDEEGMPVGDPGNRSRALPEARTHSTERVAGATDGRAPR
jgi:hypothetical protein